MTSQESPLAKTQPTVTIQVTDAMIDRAVASLLRGMSYDDDGDTYETVAVDVRKMVRDEVAKRIDKEICTAIGNTAREVVAQRVAEILDAGFPVYSSWGERNGTKTLAQIVGEAVFAKDTYSKDLRGLAREHMHKCVEQLVREHVKSLSCDIQASMKAAASEALAKWMASTLGVKP